MYMYQRESVDSICREGTDITCISLLWVYACYYYCIPSSSVHVLLLAHFCILVHLILVYTTHLVSEINGTRTLHTIALVSLLFGTVILTSFSLLMEMLFICATTLKLVNHISNWGSLQIRTYAQEGVVLASNLTKLAISVQENFKPQTMQHNSHMYMWCHCTYIGDRCRKWGGA